jgi:hypothetical protein
MGLGFATLKPVRGTAAMKVADVDRVTVEGLLFDAAETESPVLLEAGPEGSEARHSSNPTLLADVFFRVGGAGIGRAKVSLAINSSDVIVDHTWIWRADHGTGSAGRRTPRPTAWLLPATTSLLTASLLSTTRSFRFSGRATAGEPTSTSQRSLTIG